MNPKPFAELNHFTVPVATLAFSLVPAVPVTRARPGHAKTGPSLGRRR